MSWFGISSFSIIGLLASFAAVLNRGDVIQVLGAPSFASIKIFILSLIFPLGVGKGILRLFLFKKSMNRGLKIVALIYGIIAVIAVVYLWHFEIIGLRTWAY